MTVLLGTLWCSIKQNEVPYVFDWENAIALDTMQGNRASSGKEGNVSCVFLSCGRNLGYILELQRGPPLAAAREKSPHSNKDPAQTKLSK